MWAVFATEGKAVHGMVRGQGIGGGSGSEARQRERALT